MCPAETVEVVRGLPAETAGEVGRSLPGARRRKPAGRASWGLDFSLEAVGG